MNALQIMDRYLKEVIQVSTQKLDMNVQYLYDIINMTEWTNLTDFLWSGSTSKEENVAKNGIEWNSSDKWINLEPGNKCPRKQDCLSPDLRTEESGNAECV